MKLLISLFITSQLVSLPILASTFVGNGGNVGDVELMVTKKQLVEALQYISKNDINKNSCKCENTFNNHIICESLKDLGQKRKTYCAQTLKNNSKILLAKLNDKSDLKFNWTHDKISVYSAGETVAADAVTDPKRSTITLNIDRFLELSPPERLFLLAHESLHLIKHKGKYLTDSGKIGPFQSQDGQKRLLNSIAASLVMTADKRNLFRRYRRALNRAQGWKENWVSLGLSHSSFLENSSKTFFQKSFTGGQLSYAHYWDKWGLVTSLSALEAKKDMFTSSHLSEKHNKAGLGVSYRIFPFSNPLTLFGQSYFSFNLMAEYLESTIKLNDQTTGLKNKENSFGGYLGAQYTMPIFLKLWIYAKVGISFHNYEHIDLNIKNDSILSNISTGVSYGF